MNEKVKCPECNKLTHPKIIKNDKMLIGIECSHCGYNMIKEVMQAKGE